jgi:1-acyl-sn-glycerol-3-phosphate acyltransferase
MIRRIIYLILRTLIEISYHIYVKHFEVINSYKEKKRDSIIYASNHSNAFFDAFSIIFSQNKIPVFLTRAGVFNSKTASFFLNLFYMIPIYRQSDGVKEISKNQKIIAKCIEYLKEGRHPVAIFPEGNHNRKLGVRPLKKGIARIAFETLDKYPDLDLKIIPIGVNYSNPRAFRANVLVLKGPPIYIKPFYEIYLKNKLNGMNQLLDTLSLEISKLTLAIPEDNYEKIHDQYLSYRSHGSDLKLNFEEDKKLIENLLIGNIPVTEKKSQLNKKLIFYFRIIICSPIWLVAWLSNLLPVFLVRLIVKKTVWDDHFIDSIKVGVSAFLFPIIYLIQAFVLYLIFDSVSISIVYFLMIPIISKFYYEYLYKFN